MSECSRAQARYANLSCEQKQQKVEEKYLKQEADEILDLDDDSTDIMVDNYKDLELEMIKST